MSMKPHTKQSANGLKFSNVRFKESKREVCVIEVNDNNLRFLNLDKCFGSKEFSMTYPEAYECLEHLDNKPFGLTKWKTIQTDK